VAACILEQIAAFVKTALDELVVSGAASSVDRPLRTGTPRSPADKALVLYQDDPALDEEAPMGFKQWVQPFAVDCYVKPSDASTTPVDTAVNEIRAQVEKKLREAPTCGGLAIDLRIGEPEGFVAANGAFEGVRVNFAVLYRHLENDPYSQS